MPGRANLTCDPYKPVKCRKGEGGEATHPRGQASLDVIIRSKDFAVRPDFRQHIDDAGCPRKSWAHDVLIELRRNIDATVGYAFIERCWSGQPLQAALLGLVRKYPMQGNGIFVVHPEDVLSVEIVAQRGHEAPRWCGLILRAHIRQVPITDPGDGVVTPGQAQEGAGRAEKSSVCIEYKDSGVHLVDDNERHAPIVT